MANPSATEAKTSYAKPVETTGTRQKQRMKRSPVTFDRETKTYSCRIVIGDKDPLSPKNMKVAMNRAISGIMGRWRQEQIRQLKLDLLNEVTDTLFWFEEGWQ